MTIHTHEKLLTFRRKACGCVFSVLVPMSQVRQEGKTALEQKYGAAMKPCKHGTDGVEATWSNRTEQHQPKGMS